MWRAGEDKVVDARARIDLVEPMGNEIFLHGSSEGDELTARVAPRTLPTVGEDVAFVFDRTKLHFFDSETQERIG